MKKRLFDIILSVMLSILLSWILLIITILVLCFLGWPVLFVQRRSGLNGKIFLLYKFRTMKDEYDRNGQLLSDDKRLTKFGKFLRKSSLDELPELFNILKGDMSFVGPRPLLVEYLPLYSKAQAKRHEVMPGITGWAQINGRNAISWEEKFKLDVWYVNNYSFYLDIKILFLTLLKVFRGVDVNTKDDGIMPYFKG